VSATPEQIAEVLGWIADGVASDAVNENAWEPNKDRIAQAETLRAAAALIRAQAERVRVLEIALKPFADASDGLEDGDYDARIVAWIGNAEPNNGGAYGLHASDFRRARAVLKAAP
jgi:hypothetical protein